MVVRSELTSSSGVSGAAATSLRLAFAAHPRLGCHSIAHVPARTPANDVAPVAANPAPNERDLQTEFSLRAVFSALAVLS